MQAVEEEESHGGQVPHGRDYGAASSGLSVWIIIFRLTGSQHEASFQFPPSLSPYNSSVSTRSFG